MSKRIYVGNLPWSVTKEKLDELFSGFGDIEDSVIVANKYTGRSRGFGFVTFVNDADADKAISEMNEKEVESRKLLVKTARPLRSETKSDEGTMMADNTLQTKEPERKKTDSKKGKEVSNEG